MLQISLIEQTHNWTTNNGTDMLLNLSLNNPDAKEVNLTDPRERVPNVVPTRNKSCNLPSHHGTTRESIHCIQANNTCTYLHRWQQSNPF